MVFVLFCFASAFYSLLYGVHSAKRQKKGALSGAALLAAFSVAAGVLLAVFLK